MSTITLPNIRVGSDLQVRVRLKDGGVAIDWSTLSNIKACIYSDAQRALAGRCAFSIDEEDNTLLVCTYAANKPQYLGVNRIVISAKYMGETKTYDKPAFSFVRWTADQEGEEITIDDPDVDVEITVEDVSSSILQEAVDAAFSAADRANEAAAAAEHMVDIHTGPEGKSAYEVAVEEGYTGTEEEWLASLKGDTGETPDISIGTVTTVEPGTPAAASMTGTPEAPVLNLSIPKGLVGATPNFTVGTVTTGEPGSSVIVTITGTPEAPVLNLTIPQGMQGNTGSSVDYPYELVNNLTTNDATKGLSAAQGVVLAGQVSQLEHKVDELTNGVDLVVNTPKIIILSGGVGTIVPEPDTLVGWGYYEAECGQGSKITLSGNGGNYGLWGFVDASGYILSWSGTNARETNKEITAPAGTARVIVNTYNPGNYPAPKLISSTSLVGRINNLDSEVSETNKKLGQLLSEKSVSPVFVTDKYINGSGTIATASGYEYGSFDAESGDIVIVRFTLSGGSVSAISVSNSDLSLIAPKVRASVGNNEYQYLCTEDCKVVISGAIADFTYKVLHSRIDNEINDSGLTAALQRVFPEFTIYDGGYRTKTGTIASLGGWQWTSGELLKKGSVISLYWDGLNNPYIAIVTEVDSQGGFIRSCLTTPSPNVAGYLKFVVDKDGYYSISNTETDIYKYEIVYFAIGDLFFNPPLDHLFLPTQDGLPREILRTPSFVGIVHKWGFIGDSLSSGEQAVRRDGQSTIERFDLYDYSWGQRMCKLNFVEGYNFSVGGQTTKGWCNGSNERTWAGAQLQENWKEAYCIALGVNDTVSLSPGVPDTDINLSDYTQNADTFAGWYAGIIQRLRSVNPKCRIFCITIPYNNQQGYLDNNEVIRAIVPKFNRCYLVDLANYHWTPSGLALNDHLSPAGYEWAAWEINTYIDWIIRNNMDDFKDIAWVGTEYSA